MNPLGVALLVSLLLVCAGIISVVSVWVSSSTTDVSSESSHEALIIHVLYSALFVPHYGSPDAYASCADVRTRLGALSPALMVSVCTSQGGQSRSELAGGLHIATCICPEDQRPVAHNDFRGFAIVARAALFPLGTWNCERSVALLPDAAALDYAQSRLCNSNKLGTQGSCLCSSSLNFVSTRDARVPCAPWTSAALVTPSYGSVAVVQLSLAQPSRSLELLLLPATNVELVGVALQASPNTTIAWPWTGAVTAGDSFEFHFRVCLPECETATVTLEAPCG